MNALTKARHIVRRYAEGGSDDETTPPPLLGWGVNPVRNVAEQRPVLQIDPLSGPRGAAAPMPTEPAPAPSVPKEEVPVGAPPIQGSEVKPASQEGVAHWSQAIADHLVGRHGDDYSAAEQAIRGIATNYSQRAADAVWDKMPLEHQMGMMTARMQSDLGPAAFRMATDPANFPQQQAPSAELHTIRGQAADPDSLPNAGKPINIEDFFGSGEYHPGHVQSLSDQQVANMWNQFTDDPAAWKEAKERFPEMTGVFLTREADAARVNHPEWYKPMDAPQRAKPPVNEWTPLTEEQYGAGPEHTISPGEPESKYWADRTTHPFSDMSNSFLDYFNKNIAPKTGDKNVYDFAKRFFGGYDTKNVQAQSNGGSLFFSGTLKENGKKVASIDRDMNPEAEYAHHGGLEIDPAFRGVAGPRILRGQMDTYKALGINNIDVTAGLDGGGYAWARYGFLTNATDWNRIRTGIQSRLKDNGEVTGPYGDRYQLDDPTAVKALRRIISWPNPRGMWDLADFPAKVTDRDGYKQTIGNAMLAGTHWSGTFNPQNPDQTRRFDRYVEKKFEKAKAKKPASD